MHELPRNFHARPFRAVFRPCLFYAALISALSDPEAPGVHGVSGPATVQFSRGEQVGLFLVPQDGFTQDRGVHFRVMAAILETPPGQDCFGFVGADLPPPGAHPRC